MSNYNYYRIGNVCAEKILYPDGIGCTLWTPLPENEEVGVCFDFAYEDIDDLIEMLYKLKEVEADLFDEDIPPQDDDIGRWN